MVEGEINRVIDMPHEYLNIIIGKKLSKLLFFVSLCTTLTSWNGRQIFFFFSHYRRAQERNKNSNRVSGYEIPSSRNSTIRGNSRSDRKLGDEDREKGRKARVSRAD